MDNTVRLGIMPKWEWLIIILMFFSLYSGGCSVPLDRENEPEIPGDRILPTETISFTATSTIRPSTTPLPTRTATWTPLPTLLPDQAKVLILDLLETNGGCQLPCWWGIAPGETPWNVAKRFLETFADKTIAFKKLNRLGDDGLFYFEFLVPEHIHCSGVLDVAILVTKGTVEDIRLNQDIVLHEFLSNQGSPAEIWIAVGTNSPVESVYLIVFYYPAQGYWLSYFDGQKGYILEGDELFVSICPSVDSDPRISKTDSLYWNPDREIEFLSAIAGHLIPEDPNKSTFVFLPLEGAINIDIESFVSTFLDADAKDCFLTPLALWRPGQ